jgi:hypothetical protein
MMTKRQALTTSLLLLLFLSCWAIVKDDLTRVFHNFHEHELFEKSLNDTFIVLIPKKIGQLEVKDFRLISLVGSVCLQDFGESSCDMNDTSVGSAHFN